MRARMYVWVLHKLAHNKRDWVRHAIRHEILVSYGVDWGDTMNLDIEWDRKRKTARITRSGE